MVRGWAGCPDLKGRADPSSGIRQRRFEDGPLQSPLDDTGIGAHPLKMQGSRPAWHAF